MQEVGVHTLNWIEKLRKEYPIVVKSKNDNEKTKNSELDNKIIQTLAIHLMCISQNDVFSRPHTVNLSATCKSRNRS